MLSAQGSRNEPILAKMEKHSKIQLISKVDKSENEVNSYDTKHISVK